MKLSKRRFSRRELIMVFILAFWPLLFYCYLLFPAKPTIRVFSYEIVSLFHGDFQTTMWVVFTKISLIILLTMWYFTNINWWRYALLPLLSLTYYQCGGFLYSDLVNTEIINHNPISIITVIVISGVHIYLDKLVMNTPFMLTNKIETDTNEMLIKLIKFNKMDYQEMKSEFEMLYENRNILEEKEYLYKLIALQKAIIDIENKGE